MPHSILPVQPPLNFIPQRFNLLVYYVFRALLPILLRIRVRPWLPTGIQQIEAANVEALIEIYQKFQDGKIRFLIAFRHPEVDDPLCMMYLLSYALPKVALQRGISLQYPVHSYFLYDRGMTIWAGNWLGWFFSCMGGLPIFRGKLDRVSLRAVRELLANGKFPMSVAPEGATNGHSEIVSPLEPGVAQMSFWCVEELVKTHRLEEVLIVPVGIQYSYINPSWAKLDWLLGKLEADSGLPVQQIHSPNIDQQKAVCERLFLLGEHILSQMEQFYDRFHIQEPTVSNPTPPEDSSTDPYQALDIRLEKLLDRSLRAAEQFFGLEPHGTTIERCRRIELVSWENIYRRDLPDLRTFSPLQRGLADWIAEEASLRTLHMRLVESFVAVKVTDIQQQPSFEKLAETSLILFDLIARIKGEKNPGRPRLGWRKARLTVGEAISVTERWSTYQTNRHAARQAVEDLTQDLQLALEKLVS